MEHYEKERDVYYLVFHELLRAIDIDDDNYLISKSIYPFPNSRRQITRINPIYPLLKNERLDSFFNIDNLSLRGTGCPLNQFGTRIDYDKENNQLNISFENYILNLTEKEADVVSYKNCALAIPIEILPNKRLVLTQLDLIANVDINQNYEFDFGGEVFFSGDHNQAFSKRLKAHEYTNHGRSLLRITAPHKSACGGVGIFRINTFAKLQKTQPGSKSAASLSKLNLFFNLEDCP